MPASKPPTNSTPGNRLLAKLPADELRRLQPLLEPVPLKFKQVLHKVREPADYAYFPISGMASAVAQLEGGAAIEVGTTGSEGVVGPATYLGLPSAPNEVFMQVSGEGLRMEAGALIKAASRDGPLRDVLTRYHAYFLYSVSQSVACNGLHTVGPRCCRWLLITHDRVGGDELPLTHEFLATMLGVRRASVTLVLQPLQESGLIRGGRGKITVLDRRGLEVAACECYQRVQHEYTRLLGDSK
jgi:CRP-like cAMP-binding protein